MKKALFCFLAFLTLSIVSPVTFAHGTDNPSSSPVVAKSHEKNEPAEVKILLSRLDEIKAIDKSRLNSSEKKKLRKEVRTIDRRLKDISGGVYISAGTLILIVILLIIFL